MCIRDSGNTALIYAASGGHEAVVKLLLETGEVDINSRDGVGNTALSRAVENGHEAVVEAVVKLLRLH